MAQNPRGIQVKDVPTSLSPVVQANSAAIVVIAAAPVHSLPGFNWSPSGYAQVVNVPVLCTIASDFTTQLGISSDWVSYPAVEVYDHAFVENAVSPVIVINPWDPYSQSTTVAPASLPVTATKVAIPAEVILASLTVKGTSNVIYVKDTDFSFAYNDDSLKTATLTAFAASPMAAETAVTVGYSIPNLVENDADAIVGGTDVSGNYSGLEVLERVYNKTGIVPATVIAPGWAHDPTVIAAGNARVQNINNGRFRAIFLADVDTTVVRNYTGIFAWKNTNNVVSAFECLGWPMFGLGPTKKYHFSTVLAVAFAVTDAKYSQIPYVVPSNKGISVDRTILLDGSQVDVDFSQADAIENWGVVTACNDNGWKLIGDYTAAYPADTDVHDFWINERRMANWLGSSLSLTLGNYIDLPGNVRSLTAIGETIQQFGNSLVSVGAANTFRVRFLPEENLAVNVMAGRYTYHILWTPPTPIRTLDLLLEYDVNGLTAWISNITISSGS